MCERSRQIIPGLLTRINALQGELAELNRNDSAKKIVFGKVCAVVVVAIVFLCISIIW